MKRPTVRRTSFGAAIAGLAAALVVGVAGVAPANAATTPAGAAVVKADSRADSQADSKAAAAATGVVSGHLRAGQWTKVLWGWGYYSVDYGASIDASGGEYRCYTAPLPWPVSSGTLPHVITHRVIGYGDCWLYSPVEATYYLVPVFP